MLCAGDAACLLWACSSRASSRPIPGVVNYGTKSLSCVLALADAPLCVHHRVEANAEPAVARPLHVARARHDAKVKADAGARGLVGLCEVQAPRPPEALALAVRELEGRDVCASGSGLEWGWGLGAGRLARTLPSPYPYPYP